MPLVAAEDAPDVTVPVTDAVPPEDTVVFEVVVPDVTEAPEDTVVSAADVPDVTVPPDATVSEAVVAPEVTALDEVMSLISQKPLLRLLNCYSHKQSLSNSYRQLHTVSNSLPIYRWIMPCFLLR